MNLLDVIVLDLIVTVFLYLIVPIILCLSERKMTLPQIKKIAILNGAMVWLIITIVRVEQGGDGKSAAGLVWAFIAYWLMKKKCLHKENKLKQNHEYCHGCGNVLPIGSDFCGNCGTKIDAHNKTKLTQQNADNHVRICVSPLGETPKTYGNYSISGEDISIQKNADTSAAQHIISQYQEEFISKTQRSQYNQHRKSDTAWIVIALAILTVVAVALVMYRFMNNTVNDSTDYYVSENGTIYENEGITHYQPHFSIAKK